MKFFRFPESAVVHERNLLGKWGTHRGWAGWGKASPSKAMDSLKCFSSQELCGVRGTSGGDLGMSDTAVPINLNANQYSSLSPTGKVSSCINHPGSEESAGQNKLFQTE